MRIAMFLCFSLLSFPFMKETQAEEEPPQQSLELREVLSREGKRLDCHFTLELFSPLEKGVKQILYTPVQPFSADSVKSLATALQEQIPNAAFIIRESQPKVVHIIDRRLLKLADYPLEQNLNLSYSGTPTGLTYDLEKRLPNLSLVRGGFIGDVYNDEMTPVALKDAEGKVRDILTSAVPLKGYSHILWRARSEQLADGKWSIQLMYFGPKVVEGEVK